MDVSKKLVQKLLGEEKKTFLGMKNSIRKNKNFFQKQKRLLQKKTALSSLKQISKKVKENKLISKIEIPEYKKFLHKVKDADYQKLLKVLPRVLLALSILAMKNASAIKTMMKAYSIASKSFEVNSYNKNFFIIIKEYVELLSKLHSLEKVDQVLGLFVLFVEELPKVLMSKGNVIYVNSNSFVSFSRDAISSSNNLRKLLERK